MRLGLIADIHEHVEFLRVALDRFRQKRVDQIVVLGDVFEMGERIEETCRLLAEAHAVGVWGNHDFGLCDNPSDSMWAKYPASVIEYMTTLRPRMELDGCYFAHVEPWLDPEDIHDLWFVDGPPDSDGRSAIDYSGRNPRRAHQTSGQQTHRDFVRPVPEIRLCSFSGRRRASDRCRGDSFPGGACPVPRMDLDQSPT